MGYRAYVTQASETHAGDPCLGKLYGYAVTKDCLASLRILVQALRDTPEDLSFQRSYTCSIDNIFMFPDGANITEELDTMFCSSYRLTVRFPKILFCEWLKAYHHEHVTRGLIMARECTNLRDILNFYNIKLEPLSNYVYVYWV